MKELLLFLALLAMLACAIGYMVRFNDDCHARGGATVRGMIGLECVAGPKNGGPV